VFFIRMAGRLNLAITGVQDTLLTGNPSMSYFLSRFKIPTRFAFENKENQFTGKIDYGEILTCKVPTERGDFIKNFTIKLSREPLLPQGSSWSPSSMYHLIEYAELIIGGTIVEKITGEYIYLYQQLRNTEDDTRQGLYFLNGHGDLLTLGFNYVYFLDLPFYFYRNPSLSIPICALTKHSVEVRVKLRNFNELILDNTSYGGKISGISLDTEYVYVSPEERAYFMSNEINQIITQVQLSTFEMDNTTLKKDVLLKFSHPVKEMYFVSQSNVSVESNYPNQYNTIKSIEFKINNETLFKKSGKEVSYDQVLEKYINSPISSEFGGLIETNDRRFGPNIFGIHSFSLNPMSRYPTGQLNMSRISHKMLSLEIKPLENVTTTTVQTVVENETSEIPYTLTSLQETPFKDTVINRQVSTITTPVTNIRSVSTPQEDVFTTTTVTTTTKRTIGLESNIKVTVTNSQSPLTTRSTNEPVTSQLISSTLGTSSVVQGQVSKVSNVRVFSDPVISNNYVFEAKTNIITNTDTSIQTFTNTSSPLLVNKQVTTFEDTITTRTETQPTITLGIPGGAPLQTSDQLSDTITGSGSVNYNNFGGVSTGNPSSSTNTNNANQDTSLDDLVRIATGDNGSAINFFPPITAAGTGILLQKYATGIANGFDITSRPLGFFNSFGQIGKISRNSSRIMSPRGISNGRDEGQMINSWRYVTSTGPYNYPSSGSSTSPIYIQEMYRYEREMDFSNLINASDGLETGKERIEIDTNFDGSIIVMSQYVPSMVWSPSIIEPGYNGRSRFYIHRYYENWDDDRIGMGVWGDENNMQVPILVNQPSSMTAVCHLGFSLSMNKSGLRFATSGISHPYLPSDSKNKVVIYDIQGNTYSPTIINLPDQGVNDEYGIQVKLSDDGNKLCVSMHGSMKSDVFDFIGKLYLYEYKDSTWSMIEELPLPPNVTLDIDSAFGRNISTDSDFDKIVVGAANYNQGTVFVYQKINEAWETIHEITSANGVPNFGELVDMSGNGEKIIVAGSGATNGIEIWSQIDSSDTWYHEINGSSTHLVTSVSINDNGSKYVYGTTGGKMYVKDDRVTDTEFDPNTNFVGDEVTPSGAYYLSFGRGTAFNFPTFTVPIDESTIIETNVVDTITSNTFTEVLTETVDRVEEIVSLQTLVTHGISGTTVTEVGTRNQNEITTTQTETQSNQHFSQKHKNRVYAINYNVLSFKDGLSGLRF
jgi:hypothetical protein